MNQNSRGAILYGAMLLCCLGALLASQLIWKVLQTKKLLVNQPLSEKVAHHKLTTLLQKSLTGVEAKARLVCSGENNDQKPISRTMQFCSLHSPLNTKTMAQSAVDGSSILYATTFPYFQFNQFLSHGSPCPFPTEAQKLPLIPISSGSLQSARYCQASTTQQSLAILGNIVAEKSTDFIRPEQSLLVVSGFIKLSRLELHSKALTILSAGDIIISEVVNPGSSQHNVELISSSGEIKVAKLSGPIGLRQIGKQGVSQISSAAINSTVDSRILLEAELLSFMQE